MKLQVQEEKTQRHDVSEINYINYAYNSQCEPWEMIKSRVMWGDLHSVEPTRKYLAFVYNTDNIVALQNIIEWMSP